MKIKEFQTGLMVLTIFLGLFASGAVRHALATATLLGNATSMEAEKGLEKQKTDMDLRHQRLAPPFINALNDDAVPMSLSLDTGILLASAPQADGCEGKWELTNSHRSLVCIDDYWQNMDFEHWACQKPNRVVEHTHRSRTQKTCKER